MLCPEAYVVPGESLPKEEEKCYSKNTKKITAEGTPSLELNSYKNPKTWKKSITNFFRNQHRSTKSNEGDRPSENQDQFDDKDLSPEQKWQSLGKIFRRQSYDHWSKSPNQPGESSHNKRLGVTKVLSSYFGKFQKSPSATDDK